MRHVASLRSDGITVVLHILRRLCLLGGLADAPAGSGSGSRQDPSAPSAPAIAAPEPRAGAAATGAAQGPAGGAEGGLAQAAGARSAAPAPEQPSRADAGEVAMRMLHTLAGIQTERPGSAGGSGGGEEMLDASAGPSTSGAVGEGSGGPGASGGSGPVAMATDGAATPSSPAGTPPPSGGGSPAMRAPGQRFADVYAPAAPAVPLPRPAGGSSGGGGDGAGGEGGAPGGSSEGSAEPAAVPPLDLSGEAEPGPAGDAGAWLAESVSHAARMLEPLLGTADSASEFVARGGVRSLLALYALPALPPTFGSSAAAQVAPSCTLRDIS